MYLKGGKVGVKCMNNRFMYEMRMITVGMTMDENEKRGENK